MCKKLCVGPNAKKSTLISTTALKLTLRYMEISVVRFWGMQYYRENGRIVEKKLKKVYLIGN
jgi:hypothetical protein